MTIAAEQLTEDFSYGMYDSVAPARYPKAAVAQLLNARIQPDGTARRRPGSIRTSSAAIADDICYGATHFRTAAGVDQLVNIVGGTAKYSTDEGATWNAIATGLRKDYYSFATMRVGATNYLYCANGDTTIKKWTGAAWSTVAAAPSGVKYIAVFNGRLWATGHSGVLLQGSATADPETWSSPSGVTLQIIVHSGNVPTGLFQVGQHLLVFDLEATSYVDGYGEQTLITATGATGWSRSVGCVAFRTITAVGDNGCAWLSHRGIEYYIPGSGIQLVSGPIQDFMASVDWEQIGAHPGIPTACYDSIEQNLHLGITTTNSRNNRVVVLNLRQADVQYQRTGPAAACALDVPLGVSAGDLLFGSDSDGYLTDLSGGYELIADANGYWSLDTESVGGLSITEDANGYLDSVDNDACPATLFAFPTSTRPSVVFSGGYDGYIRKHYGVDLDDLSSDESGGAEFSMILRDKPVIGKNPAQRKRARAIHIASIQDATSTVTVLVRAGGKTTTPRSLTMLSLGAKPYRHRPVRTSVRGDYPQVEVQTADDVRLALVGMSYELLREPV